MKYKQIIFFVLFFPISVAGQHNMLGKSQKEILSLYNTDPEYIVKVDTLNSQTILITCKTSALYPYYTYEVNRLNNRCVSFGFVSKDKQILDSYIDILEHVGERIESDSTFTNFTYKVSTASKIVYYSVKQPFINSEYISRRNIFYVLVTETE